MRKIDVLTLLGLFVGGLLALGDGAVVGVPLLAASAYLLAKPRTRSTRRRLTAALGPLGR
ncbi:MULTISPECIES: hypothetical protein [Halorussus]|uniref:hypothetical protein n=1 Tax=Halorussus TaxID=1070314 RepID=UPI000E20DE9D|nr:MULTISPECIES: hypothetical protein [Halorussus]NHN60928.1 hypothetical protein [Halorussus sp. JP-T4]